SVARPGDRVVDPFSGSGTVLQECSAKGMNCYGYEINPAAYAMSKFFSLANTSLDKRMTVLKSLNEKLVDFTVPLRGLPFLQDSEDYRGKYSLLLEFAAKLFDSISNREERLLAINTVLLAESHRRKNFNATIENAFD